MMMLRWMAAVLLSLGLIGCGQKGDLYLPPVAVEKNQAPQAASSKQESSTPTGQQSPLSPNK
tara:strand:+ start:748 stop:933 length:186 start_codon:yes stop_codon:yes gene_type:complete